MKADALSKRVAKAATLDKKRAIIGRYIEKHFGIPRLKKEHCEIPNFADQGTNKAFANLLAKAIFGS